MYVLVVIVIGMQTFTFASKEDCVKHALLAKQSITALLGGNSVPVWCVPEKNWKRGEQGMIPENEVK